MNMMTPIAAHQVSSTAKSRKLFLDENGEPSDRAGPDLLHARPLPEVVRGLQRARSKFASEFWIACKESGIFISVTRDRNGEDHLGLGFPLDGQEKLRKPRYDALRELIGRSKVRRQAVIDLANALGHYADNQPYSSIEEAIAELLAAGIVPMISPEGKLEHRLALKGDQWNAQAVAGWTIQRAKHRYDATLRVNGVRDGGMSIVRELGVPCNGWIVLDAKEILNA